MLATMNHSSRQLPPMAPRKRKERDEMFDFLKPSRPPHPTLAKPIPKRAPPLAVAPIKPSKMASLPPAHPNVLLAGYLAHEFLTKGILCGQLYDPARANAPLTYSTSLAGFSTMKEPNHGFINRDKGKVVTPNPRPSKNKNRVEPNLARYAEVPALLKDGAHIPGIVNPSQLVCFLNLEPENK